MEQSDVKTLRAENAARGPADRIPTAPVAAIRHFARIAKRACCTSPSYRGGTPLDLATGPPGSAAFPSHSPARNRATRTSLQKIQTIRDTRLAAGLTVAELAAAARVGETTVKRAERGEHISAGSLSNLEIALRRALAVRAQVVDAARWQIATG